MPTVRILALGLLALTLLPSGTHAQSRPFSSLPFSLFERYLEVLRQQAGIPGLSASIVQGGQLVWEYGAGHRDVDALLPATPDTLYPILDLSQTVSSTLLLQQCLDLRYLEITDRVRRWSTRFPEERTTVGQLMAHAQPEGVFQYDTARYSALTDVIEQCTSEHYPRLVAEELLDRLGMAETVPGRDPVQLRALFSSNAVERFERVLQRMAVPYRVDNRGRPSRSEYPGGALTASGGLVSTVRDLARFDAALDDDGVLLEASTRGRAWQPADSLPTGLGWFVQSVNGERIVWHFGLTRDAYSALYVKVPGRRLTLILLANSDALAAPYNLSTGDVTASLFAQLFLRLFVP